MERKLIYQVDAFTDQAFKGNPAGVCIPGEKMPEEWMQNIAMEMNLSETAFLYRNTNGFDIRFFTPEAEVPLCGHASLSSAHIIYETGLVSHADQIILNSKAGLLKARTSDNWIFLDFPSYDLIPSDLPPDLEDITGVNPLEFLRSSNGWAFLLLKDENAVRAFSPDFTRMKYSSFGDMIVTAPSAEKAFDFCVRCFAPALGINEDPVTGSAHCVLAPFWAGRTGKNKFISHQVSKREGILKVEYKGERVEIAGQAKTIFTGELLV